VARARFGDGKKVVGMVTISMKDGVGKIGLLAVDHEHRGSGIGKKLMASAFGWIMREGSKKCLVVTPSLNVEARALNVRCGGVLDDSAHQIHFWLGLVPFLDPEYSEIPNNKPYLGGQELVNLKDLFETRAIQTRSSYTEACETRLEKELNANKVVLVNSGTAALEMASLIIGSEPGVEVIMPSYTFVSTANSFVNHGATPVFVDIREDTQNIDERLIEQAITPRTKAICCVHYAGVACEMDAIMDIANRHALTVIEDNAHGVFSTYKGRMLGTIGHLGALSFHYTKNIVCGEGGALVVNSRELLVKAMIVLEKGTNRFSFLQGRVSKYAWVDKGGSYVLNEIASAVLAAQLEIRPMLIATRMSIWNKYHAALEPLELSEKLRRPILPEGCIPNGHIYYLRILSKKNFDKVAVLSKQRKIGIFTHYEPLHSSAGGNLFGIVANECLETTKCAQQLYRLPMWVGLTDEMIALCVQCIIDALA